MRHVAALTILLALVACANSPTRPSEDAAFSTPIPGDVFRVGNTITIRWRSTSLASVGIVARRVAGGAPVRFIIACDAPSEPTGGAWPWFLDPRYVGPGVYELTLYDGGFPCATPPATRPSRCPAGMWRVTQP